MTFILGPNSKMFYLPSPVNTSKFRFLNIFTNKNIPPAGNWDSSPSLCFLFSDMAHPPSYEAFYLAAPPPEYSYPAADRNGINTLFVSGLPDDVKAREIHNLFRRRPGFESCQLKYTGRGNQVSISSPLTIEIFFFCWINLKMQFHL